MQGKLTKTFAPISPLKIQRIDSSGRTVTAQGLAYRERFCLLLRLQHRRYQKYIRCPGIVGKTCQSHMDPDCSGPPLTISWSYSLDLPSSFDKHVSLLLSLWNSERVSAACQVERQISSKGRQRKVKENHVFAYHTIDLG